MHLTSASFLSLILPTIVTAFPSPRPADRGLSKRNNVTGHATTIFDGGWYFSVLLGGQEVLLNIDTGSSDL